MSNSKQKGDAAMLKKIRSTSKSVTAISIISSITMGFVSDSFSCEIKGNKEVSVELTNTLKTPAGIKLVYEIKNKTSETKLVNIACALFDSQNRTLNQTTTYNKVAGSSKNIGSTYIDFVEGTEGVKCWANL